MNKLNRAFDIKLIFLTLVAGLFATGLLTYSAPAVAGAPTPGICPGSKVIANVVALDQSIMFNRLGAQNVNWMVYALERDVVVANRGTGSTFPDDNPLSELGTNGLGSLSDADKMALRGNVALRPDKRPRPLVLRVAAGDCLEVNLTNLLTPMANPLNLPNPLIDNANPLNANQGNDVLFIDDQVEGRYVSFHPLGMQLVDDIDDDGSFVGANVNNSLLAPGGSGTYTYFAEAENAYMVYSRGQPFGGEASGGNVGVGLFGVVNVEPRGAKFYRSQVTEEEMRLATKGYQAGYPEKTPSAPNGYWGDQPIVDYNGALYPYEEPWTSEGKAGLPILNMLHGNEIVHSDINAIIAGPGPDGSFPPATYPLEGAVGQNLRNPVLPNRLEAFREFTVVFHDETAATQAFPLWYSHPVLGHTLHGVRDSFMINYGSGGIGSEIIANRLRVGPMWDCLNCAYEEFFLSAYTVGDSAMLVDVPANANLELCSPADIPGTCLGALGVEHGIKANEAFFPDDPSNVHHSYKRDFVKFRNLHAGPKEQHIFHLHNHQWLFNPNDDNSNYIDAQGIGPGSGYTYEINFGGSGNRNLSAGDAIFHCHFYPHFAQGMWEMWRIHDVYETGTELAVSTADPDFGTDVNYDNIHDTPFALQSGRPADGARALPDGEILAGTPIPGLVPLPGVALPPMPGANVTIVSKYAADGVTQTASLAQVERVYERVITAGLDGIAQTIASGDDIQVVSPDTVGLDPDTVIVEPGPNGILESSPAFAADDGEANGKLAIGNPGYPFWIAGIEHTVGQRPTTPPLDMLTEDRAKELAGWGPDGEKGTPDDVTPDPLWSHPGFVAGAGGWDGGLPRHTLEGYLQGGHSVNVQNRLDFTKVIDKAKPQYFPEEGTDLEQLVMKFNSQLIYPSHALNIDGSTTTAEFMTNGLKPVPSAPFYEPCRDDEGDLFLGSGQFWGPKRSGDGQFIDSPASPFDAESPRVYMGANIQIDAVLNKAGYHFPQQRIIALWQDVLPTINQTRAPEPLVMRVNTYDCVKYLHANLVPEYYELDDYQVRTPTDIIGQHIHLPKWDLVANDGSGNGWNYEDGTLSPGAVRERIHAINAYNGNYDLVAQPHPFFGIGTGATGAKPWLGARTTIQRWFTDPVFNTDLAYEDGNVLGNDRGLGVVFTHDHYGPSTHQQVGLYATILAEPANSVWKHNETNEVMGTRADGGPTSWQAQIIDVDNDDAWREFYFEFGDFQHAYEKDVYVGIGVDGDLTAAKDPVTRSPVTASTGLIVPAFSMDIVLTPPAAPDGAETFLSSINPSFRQEPLDGTKVFPDIVRFPPECPNVVNGVQQPGVPRPCPEAISADDVGMLVTNYRNEPIGLRVFDPNKNGPDGKAGSQADGLGGDLAFALHTRTDRAIPQFNTVLGDTPYPALNAGLQPGDPYTPMLRTYPGDKIKVKIQAGSTEHEHNATIHGVKWRQGGSGHGVAPNSGWRNAQNDGISEQFTFTMPLGSDIKNVGGTSDYAYSVDASQDGWWTGMWGIARAYDNVQADLPVLPNNDNPTPGRVVNRVEFDGVCPVDATVREYQVVAMTANQLLGNDIGAQLLPNDANARDMHVGAPVDAGGGTLVYNNRDYKTMHGLHDPTALLYVNLDDLEKVPGQSKRACRDNKNTPGLLRASCQVQLKVGAPIEPIAIRGAAGDCIKATLYNKLPAVAPDLPGYNTLLQMVNRDPIQAPGTEAQGLVTFNNNLIRPSSHVGLHAQLVEYDVTHHDGTNVGLNQVQTVGPVNPDGTLDKSITYKWYAGHHDSRVATPKDCKDFGVKGKGCGKGNDLILMATPVEFGGFNLNPADKIKQGQKGLIGAGVIVPENAMWSEGVASLEQVKDHQCDPGNSACTTRGTRTSLPVTYTGGTFKDAVLVFQKALNHRLGDGSAVKNIASEGQGIPEDSHDAGQMAINYGSEPMWFRYGLEPDAPFNNEGGGSFGGVSDPELAYSNSLPGAGGDPVTPVITATPGQEVRIRVLEPTGAGRGTTFNLDGHAWQRDPYICEGSKDGLPGRCATTEAAAPTRIGHNPIGMVLGHQESVTPAAHFDIVPLNGAGGKNAIPGDYLFADQGSFGPTSGLWGILRVE